MSPPATLKVLDSLRGVYSIFVLLLHANQTYTRIFPTTITRRVVFMGHIAVDGFFFLSGFLITHVYQKKISDAMEPPKKVEDDEKPSEGENSTQNQGFWRTFLSYFWNRIARLYPLVFFSETVMLLFYNNNNAGWECLYEYFLICGWVGKWSGNTPLWSLNAEFLLYLLFPIFLWFNKKINPNKKIWISILLSLIIPICVNISRLFIDYEDEFFPILNTGPLYRGVQGFYAGICLYHIYELNPEQEKKYDYLCLITLLINIILIIYAPQIFAYVYGWFLFTFFLVKSKMFMKFIFEREVLLLVGEISFSLYLLHYPLIIYLNTYLEVEVPNGLDNKERIFVFTGLFSFIAIYSYLIYQYYEKPTRDYLRKLWLKIDKKIFEKPFLSEGQISSSSEKKYKQNDE